MLWLQILIKYSLVLEGSCSRAGFSEPFAETLHSWGDLAWLLYQSQWSEGRALHAAYQGVLVTSGSVKKQNCFCLSFLPSSSVILSSDLGSDISPACKAPSYYLSLLPRTIVDPWTPQLLSRESLIYRCFSVGNTTLLPSLHWVRRCGTTDTEGWLCAVLAPLKLSLLKSRVSWRVRCT